MIKILDITVPRSWQELTPKQAKWLHNFLAIRSGMSTSALRVFALLKFGGLKSEPLMGPEGSFTFTKKGTLGIGCITFEELASAAREMEWILWPPLSPWRPERIASSRPVQPDLSDLTFEEYLCAENYYQGYLATQDDDLLRGLADVLVRRGWFRWYSDGDLIAVLYWYMSVKEMFARRWRYLFGKASADPMAVTPSQQEIMDAQIRALTKGDITKEKEIMSLPCHRALTELNAQAKEAADLDQQLKKN